MIDFLLYIVIFIFIYSLNSQIRSLKEELFTLKRKSRLRVKGKVSFKKLPADMPIVTKKTEKKIKQKVSEPNVVDKLFSYVKSYFNEGNIVVRIGGAILFFGLAFLVKYAAEHSTISIEVRLTGIALSSVVLGVVGWRLRRREGYYGIILQGLAVAIAYLLVFASAKLYTLMPLSLSFMIMLFIVMVGSLLAIIQNALPLAIFSIGGGFLAPILTSDGSGSHIMLFSYYALLNSGIVTIAWYRSWRVLNLMGFFFTFVISVAWGILKYDPDLLISTEPFLILFFVFYLVVSILFTLKQKFEPRGIVDATLVFGLPLVAFSLQTSLVHNIEYALFFTAITMGTLYTILYKVLSRYSKMQLLSQSFLALGVIFYTIAIPNIFDNQLTGALWALEASAIIWIALKQEHIYARIFGEFLQIVAILTYIASTLPLYDEIAFLNTSYLGYIIVSIASFISAYLLYTNKEKLNDFDKNSSNIFLGIALGLWLFSGLIEARQIDIIMGNIMLIYIAITTAILALVAIKLKWLTLSNLLQNYLFLGILFFASMVVHYQQNHPFEGLGSIAIILFFSVHYFLLYLYNKEWNQEYLHLVALWAATLIGATELKYGISLLTQNGIYEVAGFGLFMIASTTTIIYKKRLLPEVFHKYEKSYKSIGVGGIVFMLIVWQLYSFLLDADPLPLPYIPLINPLELMQLFGFILMYKWLNNKEIFYSITGIFILVFSTVILARTIHHYMNIDYHIFALLRSIIFQMSLSLLWSIIAMSTILLAKHLQNRSIWIVGASLMGIVVVKLFLVELSSSGSVERIVSFIVVGLLLLLIGYFAPVPPVKLVKDKTKEKL